MDKQFEPRPKTRIVRSYFRYIEDDYTELLKKFPQKTGIRFTGRYWVADFTHKGKRRYKNFGVSQFGFLQARDLAIKQRERWKEESLSAPAPKKFVNSDAYILKQPTEIMNLANSGSVLPWDHQLSIFNSNYNDRNNPRFCHHSDIYLNSSGQQQPPTNLNKDTQLYQTINLNLYPFIQIRPMGQFSNFSKYAFFN